MFFPRVCILRLIFCLENPLMSRFGLPVTVVVFPYGLDTDFSTYMYHSVIPYRYVDSSYRSLSKGPLHLCHGQGSSLALEAWLFLGTRDRACCASLQEGVEVFSSRVCIIRYLFSSENPFVSRFFRRQRSLFFPMVHVRSFFVICITM